MAKPDPFLSLGCRYFLAIAEAGSVRAASRHLNVAPSAVSRQLILLEHQLGTPLFDRSSRQLLLSPAGETLLKGLRTAAHQHDETLDAISALQGLKRGHLKIAAVESISMSILPQVLGRFAREFPGIEVSVSVAGSEAVTEQVREHSADIGITFNPTSLEQLDAVFTRDYRVGVIMAPDHRLAWRKSVSLAECANERLAWPSRGLSLRALLDSAFGNGKTSLRPAFECDSLRLMAALARMGSCIAFQPTTGIERDLEEGALVWIPLDDENLPPDRLVIVCRKGRTNRPVTDAFLEMLKTEISTVRN
jgi:DNA-binding transcriptional LysR family regulator